MEQCIYQLPQTGWITILEAARPRTDIEPDNRGWATCSFVVSMDSSNEPKFLELIDTEPRKAAKLFADWAYNALKNSLRKFSGLNDQDREDLAQDIVFSYLKSSEDGKSLLPICPHDKESFLRYFWTVTRRKALDRLEYLARRKHDSLEFETDSGAQVRSITSDVADPAKIAEENELKSMVNSFVMELSPRCQALLSLKASGITNEELSNYFPQKKWDNKRAGTAVSDCLKSLKKKMIARQINIGDYLSDF